MPFNKQAAHFAATFLSTAGLLLAASLPLHAHVSEAFSAGAPGNPKKPARVIVITMAEGDGKMSYAPDRIEVRKGEQIKFVLKNAGQLAHEFLLATVAENAGHAEMMKAHPDMEHDDPNAKTIKPNASSELLWQFTRAGEFQYACLIPGHFEAGMHGTVVVK